MTPFRLHILGCGSALPTFRHNTTSQIVEVRGKMFMVDCGEGTQVRLRRTHIRFTQLTAVFISHIHGDHCFGLIGLISTFGMLGRTAPLHIYAPELLGPMLRAQIGLFCTGLGYAVEFHPIDTAVAETVYEDRSVSVQTIPLDHRVPCCGFLFREKPGLPHIRRDMLDFYNIPLSQVGNIKNGASWTTPDGQAIANERLTRPADAPRTYAYCSDTRYMPRLHERIAGADLLYHEATYATADKSRARLYYHSTAGEAAKVARDAGVKHLLLGHFSSRYADEQVLLQEAQAIFPCTQLADEGMVVDI
ncbi:MAG: ribonuclease Z [Prevotella sp.]